MASKKNRSGGKNDLEEMYTGEATFTLELDDGPLECAVIAVYKAMGRSYIALLPLDENGQNDDGEVYLYRYIDDGEEPSIDNIETDEEYEIASDGFDEWLDSAEYDELISDEEE